MTCQCEGGIVLFYVVMDGFSEKSNGKDTMPFSIVTHIFNTAASINRDTV